MEGAALAQAGAGRLQAPKAHLPSLPAWRRQDRPPAATAADEVLGSALPGRAESDTGQPRQADRRGRWGQAPHAPTTARLGRGPADPTDRAGGAPGLDPQARQAIRGWLKAGVLDGAELFPTEAGTPQGGPLSPLLANIALHGLETALRTAFPRDRYTAGRVDWGWQPLVVRYADDFVVLHEDRAVLEQARQLAARWLASVGLELKPAKTRIGHTLLPIEGQTGFDFLGF